MAWRGAGEERFCGGVDHISVCAAVSRADADGGCAAGGEVPAAKRREVWTGFRSFWSNRGTGRGRGEASSVGGCGAWVYRVGGQSVCAEDAGRGGCVLREGVEEVNSRAKLALDLDELLGDGFVVFAVLIDGTDGVEDGGVVAAA